MTRLYKETATWPNLRNLVLEGISINNMRLYPIFTVRTVLVQNNDVEKSLRLLNRILGREGILDDARRIMRYEKPHRARRRINGEICRNIVGEDFRAKVNFLLRKNRQEPYPGC